MSKSRNLGECMKTKKILLLIATLGTITLMASEVVQEKKMDKDLASFLEEYSPSPDTCGPDFKKKEQTQPFSGEYKNEEDPEELIKRSINTELACVIKGYKPVTLQLESKYYPLFAEHIDNRLLTNNRTLKYGLQSLKYDYKFEHPEQGDITGSYYLIYTTPEGKHRAKLLLKLMPEEDKSRSYNHYLSGFLLGYNEEDIEYYYSHPKLTGIENSKEQFPKDKQAAKEWLEKNGAPDLAALIK